MHLLQQIRGSAGSSSFMNFSLNQSPIPIITLKWYNSFINFSLWYLKRNISEGMYQRAWHTRNTQTRRAILGRQNTKRFERIPTSGLIGIFKYAKKASNRLASSSMKCAQSQESGFGILTLLLSNDSMTFVAYGSRDIRTDVRGIAASGANIRTRVATLGGSNLTTGSLP